MAARQPMRYKEGTAGPGATKEDLQGAVQSTGAQVNTGAGWQPTQNPATAPTAYTPTQTQPQPQPQAPTTPEAPQAPQVNPQQQQASDLWADMLAQYNQSLGGKLQQTYADQTRQGRAFDAAQAARGGTGLGSAGAAGAAAVAAQGTQQRLGVQNQHAKQGLEMKMAYLDKLIRQAEASNDRDLQRELQAEADKTAMALSSMGYEAQQRSEQAMADAMREQTEAMTEDESSLQFLDPLKILPF